MCAFEAHTFKDISRSQLASAAKFFTAEERQYISKADKHQLVGPLASALIKKGIVAIRDGANMQHLLRSDISKEKTF